MSYSIALPIWARPDTFPVKPQIGNFGYIRKGGEPQACVDMDALIQGCQAEDKIPLLVWTPDSEYLQVAEECVALRAMFLNTTRERLGKRAQNLGRISLLLGAVVISYLLISLCAGATFVEVLSSGFFLLIALPWLFYTLLPWYNSTKFLRQSAHPDSRFWEKEVADARFEYWLQHQKAPWTQVLSVMMIVLGAIQLFVSQGFDWSQHAVGSVALTKQASDPFWRYLTGPLAHGNLIHWGMNFAALRYLAKRMELLVGWQHMLWVIVFSAYAGAVATAYWMPEVPSVGISGGILGVLGFLLAFETRHKALVPKSPRRRLAAALASVTLLGAIGFQFVDNAAHAGGLVAGVFYGWVVFPSSTSVQRPERLKRDYITGVLALCILLVATVTCAYQMLV
ncbi:rhomboid family intramembrane serine protease [Rubritalea marina]|uniref:rhomboid family intramembrane serine protease n=1 Tax=Rubritalea marina TaxID=361055 RepID=UPI0012EA5836|nr:rhomboid family intramembrane serine protease [Rubritalea marina]